MNEKNEKNSEEIVTDIHSNKKLFFFFSIPPTRNKFPA